MNESKSIPGRVFFVSSSSDSTVLIALDVVVQGAYIRWFDTVKERVMKVKEILDKNPAHFVFEREEGEGGGMYTFIPMTSEIYNEKVKRHLLAPQDFADEEAMLKAFEETRQNAW